MGNLKAEEADWWLFDHLIVTDSPPSPVSALAPKVKFLVGSKPPADRGSNEEILTIVKKNNNMKHLNITAFSINTPAPADKRCRSLSGST